MSEKRCLYCGGRLVSERVTHLQEYDGRWVVIHNLAAQVCRQCGERFYTPEAHDQVLSLVKDERAPARQECVDVYDAEVVR